MYDDFSSDYDRFVDWPGRLAVELPFIERELQAVRARRVLDAACGTGMHAVALAQRGNVMVGADLSVRMIEQARANAVAASAEVRFEVAGFGELGARVGSGFDAVLCLGNSLPHLLNPGDLASALADFAACLRPGGLILIQNRNFDAVLARRERWMEPQTYREGEVEWIFLRFYDFEPDGTLTLQKGHSDGTLTLQKGHSDGTLAFNLVTLRREGAGKWSQGVATTMLWPMRQSELTAALDEAGFGKVAYWGDMQSAPFDAKTSPNLVVTARGPS